MLTEQIVTTIAGLRDTAGCAQLFRGEIVPAAEPGKQILVERIPYGVVFGIAPCALKTTSRPR